MFLENASGGSLGDKRGVPISKGRAALFFAALAAAALPVFSEKSPDPSARVSSLYAEGRYFELRDALSALTDDSSAETEFYRGAVDQIFNRLDSAALRLERYLRNTEGRAVPRRDKEARFLLADAYYRLGRYADSAEAYRRILARYGPTFSAAEKAGCENQAGFVATLAGFPAPSVSVDDDTIIGMTDRHFPVQVGGRIFYFEYDTGSSVSIMCWSAAATLSIPMQGPPIRIQTGTGEGVDGRIGIVSEMRMGAVVIRNAAFLILPDDAFLPMKLRPGDRPGGLLGMPILAALKEFTETRDGDLIIPARPRPRTGQNMGFSGFRPFVEILYRGERLSFCLDTGADKTALYPPFFRIYQAWIKHRTTPRKSLVNAVGGSRAVPVYMLDEFAFASGGKGLALRRVAVQTKATHAGSLVFHGNLGLDILRQCSRITFNFESMSFIPE